MPSDFSERIFVSDNPGLSTASGIVGFGTTLARSSSVFGAGLALSTPSRITGPLDEVAGVEPSLHPLLWGGYFLTWGGIALVW